MSGLAGRAQCLPLLALLVLLGLVSGCGGAVRTQHAGVGGTAGVPGALPASFPFTYRDSYRGWPLWPLHRQHPIRSSFLDPRASSDLVGGGYHFGIDISVDDAHPEPWAPRGFSHEVYAVESGEASDVLGTPRHHSCGSRRVSIGHFDYWHVSPIVTPGQHVEAGEVIGWSCLGEWHVHLAEWTRVEGVRIWVNPLHPGGKIAPYTDTAAPIVRTLRFFGTPAPTKQVVSQRRTLGPEPRLSPTRLHGRVELRAEIGDPQSYWGFVAQHSRWETLFHPYRVAVSIRLQATDRVVLRRVAFTSDQLPGTPFSVHYAPGTAGNRTIPQCRAAPASGVCAGTYWFRPFSRFHREFWDTERVPDGAYDVIVRAWDVQSNEGSRTSRVVVANETLG